MSFVRTYSGRDVSLADPHFGTINIRDIACALSRINRFCGATRLPVNVADHSLNVVRYLALQRASAAVQLLGLLHDAHEAYIGDITAPMRRQIKAMIGHDVVEAIADRLDRAVWQAFGLTRHLLTMDIAAVKLADQAVLAAEWRDLMEGPAPFTGSAASFAIKPRNPDQAEIAFLKTFDLLKLALGPSFSTFPAEGSP